MIFYGISKVFSTENGMQYETIGAFWDELSSRYDISCLWGLGYNWTENTIKYVIGLREGVIDGFNCAVELPEEGWETVKGKTEDLSKIYEEIYASGALLYEIEMFDNDGNCEVLYCR